MRKAFAAAVAASFIAMAAPAAASLPQSPFDEAAESVAPVAVTGPYPERAEVAWVPPQMTEQPYVGMFLFFLFWGGVAATVVVVGIWLLRRRVPYGD